LFVIRLVLLLIVLFCVLFVCTCVLYHCHWVSTQLQLANISHYMLCFMYCTARETKYFVQLMFSVSPHTAFIQFQFRYTKLGCPASAFRFVAISW
jgi:hypothetical protein